MQTTRLTHLFVPVGIATVLAIATPVAAGQGIVPLAARGAQPPDPPRLILSLGGASMNPVHADDYPEGPVVVGSLGFAATPRVRLEAEVTRRAYTLATARDNAVLPYSGATGVPGRADREVYGRETTDWTAGFNVVGRTPPHTVTVFAGAGVVLHRKGLRNYRTVTNCTPPASPTGPQNGACTERDERSLTRNQGLQGLAGADVNINRRWQIFAALRYEMRPDLAMGSLGFTGGARVAIR